MDKKPYKEEYDPLVGYIRTRFQQAETSRLYDEKRKLNIGVNGYEQQKYLKEGYGCLYLVNKSIKSKI